MKPIIVRVKNRALKRFVGDAVKLAHGAGKKDLGADPVRVLIFQARRRLPAPGIVFVTEIFVEPNGLEMLFLLNFGNALILAYDQAL